MTVKDQAKRVWQWLRPLPVPLFPCGHCKMELTEPGEKHRIGTVSYPGSFAALYCDGSEVPS